MEIEREWGDAEWEELRDSKISVRSSDWMWLCNDCSPSIINDDWIYRALRM